MKPIQTTQMTKRVESMSSNPITITTTNEKATILFAQILASLLKPGDFIALTGDLGAGKTRFVRGLAQGLGIDPEPVCSPTFVLMHEYTAHSSGSQAEIVLIHIDAYRLNTSDDLESIGWDELCQQTHTIMAVEWADRINNNCPTDRLDIHIEHVNEHQRQLTVKPQGQLCKRKWHQLIDPPH